MSTWNYGLNMKFEYAKFEYGLTRNQSMSERLSKK